MPQNARVDAITIRPAEPAEPDAVAGLRWQWIQEDEGEPVGAREEFVRHSPTGHGGTRARTGSYP